MEGLDQTLFELEIPRSDILVYADGSGSAKTKTGGWAWILIHDDQVIQHGYNQSLETNTTTNKMELMAVIQGLLAYIEWNDKPKDHKLTVVSDSEYVIISAAQRLKKWERNGWRTNEGPVKNLPEWKAIKKLGEFAPVKIGWGHTRGHIGNRWNEIVDKLANYKIDATGKNLEWERIVANGYYDKLDHIITDFKRYA